MKWSTKKICAALLIVATLLTLCACGTATESVEEEPLVWKDVTFNKVFYLEGDTTKQHISFKDDGTVTFNGFDNESFCKKTYESMFPDDIEWLTQRMQKSYDYMYHKGDDAIWFNLFQDSDTQDYSYVTCFTYESEAKNIVFAGEVYKEAE